MGNQDTVESLQQTVAFLRKLIADMRKEVNELGAETGQCVAHILGEQCSDCDRENCEYEDDDPGYCPTCNGSGEGMWDGSTCSECKGRG